MGLWKKKEDPLSERARALNAEIEALEAEIRRLDAQLTQRTCGTGAPRLRSTALPKGQIVRYSTTGAPARQSTTTGGSDARTEPVFEEVDGRRLKGRAPVADTPEHFNDLGVRKYDLPALLSRIRQHLRGPVASNPRLVTYLAAGGVEGPPSLRMERRVARNRFIVLVAVLFLVLLGVFSFLARNQ